MPRSEKVSGTGNNSTRTAFVSKRNKRFLFFIRDMRNLPIDPEETLYQVSFSANVRKEYGAGVTALDFSRPYRTEHPLLALRLAIADVEGQYGVAASVDVRSIRIIKL